VLVNPFDSVVVAPSNNALIPFRFEGCNIFDTWGNPYEGFANIKVFVTTNMGTDTSTISANVLTIPVKITLPEFKVVPDQRFEVPIYISIANTNDAFYNFDNAKITEFELVLKADPSQLFFDGTYIPITG
jgi:hypothetical protein